MRKAFYTIKVFIMIGRYVFRFFTGRPMNGERKTDATFFRPATRSLDPSGTALKWEMMRGAARAAWRMLGGYILSLSFLLLLLSAVDVVWDLPWYLRPGHLLLLHLAIGGALLATYVTWRGNVEYGYRLPYLIREEKLTSTEEETPEELESAESAEKVEKEWRLQWWMKEGRKHWETEIVLPLASALANQLNVTMTPARARNMLHIPRDYRDGADMEILLPDSFTGADVGAKKRLVSTVRARLGISSDIELSESWQLSGSSPRLLLRIPEELPSFISMEEVMHFLLASEEYNPFIGLVGGKTGLNISLQGDSPHFAISAGSGAGKSVLIRWIAMQFRRWGWNVIILDWKEESHEWAKGLDGVRYCTAIEDIHDMCIALGDEVEARKANPHIPRQKILVVSEEWNITAPLLADYWSDLRSTAEPEERRTMPLRSPALTARMKVNFTGRQLGISDMLVAQRFSARVTNGNADLRESFQVIFTARWKAQTLKMLFGGIKPFPKKPKNVGTWVAVIGDEPVTVQVPFATDEEARSFALSGEPAAASPWILRSPNRLSMDAGQGESLGDGPTPLSQEVPAIEAQEAPPVMLRKLSDMVDTLAYLGVTLDVLRHGAKDTQSGFPPAIGGSSNRGYLYDLHAVTEWARKRHAARAAVKK